MFKHMFKKVYVIESKLCITVHSSVLLLFVVLLKPSEIVIKVVKLLWKKHRKANI